MVAESAKQENKKLSLAEKQEKKLRASKQKEKQKAKKEPANKARFYCTNASLMEQLIKWRDSAEKPEDRVISEELGKMILMIGQKLLNRSEFRNYTNELKEDMLGTYCMKLIKGLKNYNFKFGNPFAFFTTAAWNSYLMVIQKHYKQQNIKHSIMTKLADELQAYHGVNSSSSLIKYIESYMNDGSKSEKEQ